MGWKLQEVEEREELQFDWMDEKPAPGAVLELLACGCTRSWKLSSCVCLANGLKCTDICTLKECENQVKNDEEIDLYCSDDGTDDSHDTDDEDYVQMFVFEAMLIDGKGEQKKKAENEIEKTRKKEMSLWVSCTYCMLV